MGLGLSVACWLCAGSALKVRSEAVASSLSRLAVRGEIPWYGDVDLCGTVAEMSRLRLGARKGGRGHLSTCSCGSAGEVARKIQEFERDKVPRLVVRACQSCGNRNMFSVIAKLKTRTEQDQTQSDGWGYCEMCCEEAVVVNLIRLFHACHMSGLNTNILVERHLRVLKT